MSLGEITVIDQTAGKDVRTVERVINGSNYHLQAVIPYHAGIQGKWILYAQHLGHDSIDLPYQVNNSTKTSYILTRGPMPSDLDGVLNSISASTISFANTSVIFNQRFFLDEKVIEQLDFRSIARVRGTFGVKVLNASDIGYLNTVTFELAKLNASETHTTLALKSINVSISNATTTEIEKSIVGILDLSNTSIASGEKLELIVNTLGGTANASDTVVHTLHFDAGTSKTYVGIDIEER
jgi:hypothetical protein